MVPANNRGYDGYQARPECSSGPFNIVSPNSSRPKNYSLSVIYTHEHVPGYREAMLAAQRADRFPGQHS